MEIADRIFQLLEKQGKKQSDLARFIGVRPTTVSAWKGGGVPSVDHLIHIAEFFGVSLDYLMTGKEPPPAPVVKQGIFGNGNSNNTVAFGVGGELSEYDAELLTVWGGLDIRRKTALLTFAYDLEKEMRG